MKGRYKLTTAGQVVFSILLVIISVLLSGYIISYFTSKIEINIAIQSTIILFISQIRWFIDQDNDEILFSLWVIFVTDVISMMIMSLLCLIVDEIFETVWIFIPILFVNMIHALVYYNDI